MTAANARLNLQRELCQDSEHAQRPLTKASHDSLRPNPTPPCLLAHRNVPLHVRAHMSCLGQVGFGAPCKLNLLDPIIMIGRLGAFGVPSDILISWIHRHVLDMARRAPTCRSSWTEPWLNPNPYNLVDSRR